MDKTLLAFVVVCLVAILAMTQGLTGNMVAKVHAKCVVHEAIVKEGRYVVPVDYVSDAGTHYIEVPVTEEELSALQPGDYCNLFR